VGAGMAVAQAPGRSESDHPMAERLRRRRGQVGAGMADAQAPGRSESGLPMAERLRLWRGQVGAGMADAQAPGWSESGHLGLMSPPDATGARVWCFASLCLPVCCVKLGGGVGSAARTTRVGVCLFARVVGETRESVRWMRYGVKIQRQRGCNCGLCGDHSRSCCLAGGLCR
jgi:hypothetical protein